MSIVLYEVAGNGSMRPSPYCWRIRWALAHKGLDYELRSLPYTQLNTIGDGSFSRVPVLEHRGVFVKESFIIAEYLDRAYPDQPPLFSSSIALARFFDRWTEQAIHNPTFGPVVADMHARLQPVDQGYFRQTREEFLGKSLEAAAEGRDQALPRIRGGFDALRDALGQGPFLAGNSPDYLDYIVASGFRWLSEVSAFPIVETASAIAGWLERIKQLRG